MHKNSYLFAGLLVFIIICLTVSCKKKKDDEVIGPMDMISLSPSQGFPWREITITGSTFSTVPGDNAVTFNGAAATILSASSGSLLVRLPEDGSTGPVVVKVNGVQRNGTPVFTYTQQPASTITGNCDVSAKPVAIRNFKINYIEKVLDFYKISYQFEVENTGTTTVSMSNTSIQGYISPDHVYGNDYAAGGAGLSKNSIAPGEKVLFSWSANSGLLPDGLAINGHYMFVDVEFDDANCEMRISNELSIE